jgi:hypothetical protein
MTCIAVPNVHFPPGDEALGEADVVVGSVDDLTDELLASL